MKLPDSYLSWYVVSICICDHLKSNQRQNVWQYNLHIVSYCCVILVNIRLIFEKKRWVTLKEKKGEGARDTAHTFTPVANQIIFEAPNGWFSSLCDLPAWRSTSVAPWTVIGYALNGKAIIDLGHRQCEGSAAHYQHPVTKAKRQGKTEKARWRALAHKKKRRKKKNRLDLKREGWVVEGKGEI